MAEPFFESVGPVLAAVEPQREESASVAEPFFESVDPVLSAVEPQREGPALVTEPFFESVGPVREQTTEVMPATASRQSEPNVAPALSEFVEASATAPQPIDNEILELPQEPMFAADEPNEFFEPATEEALVAA